jgi:hypothetical protein
MVGDDRMVGDDYTVAARHDPTNLRTNIFISMTRIFDAPAYGIIPDGILFPDTEYFSTDIPGLSQKAYPVVIARRNDEAIR